MAGRLTTHVLDIGRGRPAAGIAVTVYQLGRDGLREAVAAAVTNTDGRVDRSLLEGEQFHAGTYELVFEVGPYLSQQRQEREVIAEPLWDQVPIRLAVPDASEHYHIPLLIAPGGYSTYRGS